MEPSASTGLVAVSLVLLAAGYIFKLWTSRAVEPKLTLMIEFLEKLSH